MEFWKDLGKCLLYVTQICSSGIPGPLEEVVIHKMSFEGLGKLN